MGSFVFNVAKGKVAYYGSLPGTNDALIAIPIEATGVQADATLVDLDTVAAILAGSTNEQTTMGRKTLTAVSSTVDDTGNQTVVDADDVTWSSATGSAVSDVLIAYDPDTTTGDDTTLIPLTWHDFVATPDGTDLVAAIADLFTAS
jgi:hypothetical protein